MPFEQSAKCADRGRLAVRIWAGGAGGYLHEKTDVLNFTYRLLPPTHDITIKPYRSLHDVGVACGCRAAWLRLCASAAGSRPAKIAAVAATDVAAFGVDTAGALGCTDTLPSSGCFQELHASSGTPVDSGSWTVERSSKLDASVKATFSKYLVDANLEAEIAEAMTQFMGYPARRRSFSAMLEGELARHERAGWLNLGCVAQFNVGLGDCEAIASLRVGKNSFSVGLARSRTSESLSFQELASAARNDSAELDG
jgi:hypothetical protein